MTRHEQVGLVLFLLLFGMTFVFWVIDTVSEHLDTYLARKKSWRAIDVQCSKRNHPSSQATLYDWERE